MANRPRLSKFELQCLKPLWSRGEASVRQIHDDLDDPPSYSTVRKICERLEEKGAIARSHKEGRAWIYRATIRRKETIRREIRTLLDSLFGGSASPLVAHLADMDELSLDDLKEIEKRVGKPRRKTPNRKK